MKMVRYNKQSPVDYRLDKCTTTKMVNYDKLTIMEIVSLEKRTSMKMISLDK